jgi:hypothetical protein
MNAMNKRFRRTFKKRSPIRGVSQRGGATGVDLARNTIPCVCPLLCQVIGIPSAVLHDIPPQIGAVMPQRTHKNPSVQPNNLVLNWDSVQKQD